MIKILKNFKKYITNIFKHSYQEEIAFDINDEQDRSYYKKMILEQIYEAMKSLEVLKAKYEELVIIISEIQKILQFPKEQFNKIIILATKICEAKQYKNSYKQELQNYGETEYEYKYKYFNTEMEQIINKIKSLEERDGLIKNDLHYLEAEKSELDYKREQYIKNQHTVNISTIIMFCALSVMLFVFMLLSTIYEINVFVPSLISLIIAVLFIVFLFSFKRNNTYRLKKNELEYKRAIELINKVKIKYVNNKSLLDYEYKKYNIYSYEELEFSWKRFKEIKEKKQILYKTSKELVMFEEELVDYLQSKNIKNVERIIERVDSFIGLNETKEMLDNLYKYRNDLLEEINEQQQVINDSNKKLELLDMHKI